MSQQPLQKLRRTCIPTSTKVKQTTKFIEDKKKALETCKTEGGKSVLVGTRTVHAAIHHGTCGSNKHEDVMILSKKITSNISAQRMCISHYAQDISKCTQNN
jgi:hypothetical protein